MPYWQVKADELQCDVIVTIDFDWPNWRTAEMYRSQIRETYRVSAPRLKKRETWEETATLGYFGPADAERFSNALLKVISWIRENVVSK